jgi:hypothetical protein
MDLPNLAWAVYLVMKEMIVNALSHHGCAAITVITSGHMTIAIGAGWI